MSDLNSELIGRTVTITRGPYAGRYGVVLYVDREGVMVEIGGVGRRCLKPTWLVIRDLPTRSVKCCS